MITKEKLEIALGLDIRYLSNINNNAELPYETSEGWKTISIYDKRIIDNFKFYTGIGSRETPPNILEVMRLVGVILDKKGFILRSGGAVGADSSFESAAINKEIYLPERNFNDNKSKLYNINTKAFIIAESIIAHWDNLKPYAKKLHSRNVHQIMGLELSKNSKLSSMVICYTKNGLLKGGTATAIKLANKLDIKVYNLGDRKDLTYIINYIKINKHLI